MKILKKIVLIALLFNISIQQLACLSPMSYSLKHFHHPKNEYYAFNCQLIDMAQIIQGLGFLVYYRAAYNRTNLDHAIHAIRNHLKEFETWLLDEEKKTLLAIKNKYAVSSARWDDYLTNVQELKDIYTKSYQQSWKMHHDDTIAPEAYATIKKILNKNNINPQSINIQKATAKNAATVAQVALKIEFLVEKSENKLIFTKQYQPPILRIFSRGKQANPPHITTAIYAHEIQHVVQKHGITKEVLKIYLNHYYQIDENILDKCPEFQHLVQIHEAQAEVLSTLKDPEIASCLRMYRKKEYYPHYLYEEHYYNISTADMLWKVESWLTWFKNNDTTTIGKDLIAKIHTLAESFKLSFGH